MKDPDVLDSSNARDAVIAGIAELPDDIRASIGYRLAPDGRVLVTVACEPIDDDFVTSVALPGPRRASIHVRDLAEIRLQLERRISQASSRSGIGIVGRPTIDSPSVRGIPVGMLRRRDERPTRPFHPGAGRIRSDRSIVLPSASRSGLTISAPARGPDGHAPGRAGLKRHGRPSPRLHGPPRRWRRPLRSIR
jgi:hypothetical protein